jgi:hypothetical protein
MIKTVYDLPGWDGQLPTGLGQALVAAHLLVLR